MQFGVPGGQSVPVARWLSAAGLLLVALPRPDGAVVWPDQPEEPGVMVDEEPEEPGAVVLRPVAGDVVDGETVDGAVGDMPVDGAVMVGDVVDFDGTSAF